MKRVVSVCMVAVRQTIWKLLAIIAVMAAAEIALFCRLLPSAALNQGRWGSWFDHMLELSWFHWILAAAVAALNVVQVAQGGDGKGKLTYTLQRLPMGERAVTTLWGVVHTISYWILWAAQFAVVLVCWKLYTAYYPGQASSLELFTKFYYSDFLHALIPMQDYARVAMNALLFPALGFGAAYACFLVRAGQKPILPISLISVSMTATASSYRDDLGDELKLLIYVVALGYMLWRIWWGDYEET